MRTAPILLHLLTKGCSAFRNSRRAAAVCWDKQQRSNPMKAKVVSLALASAAIVGTGVGVAQLPHVGAAPALSQTPVQTQTLPDFAAIAEANKGAVVNIMVTERAKP